MTTRARLALAIFLTGAGGLFCRPPSAASQVAGAKEPETVMATFHVAKAKEAHFKQLLSREWDVYKKENLVFDQPHVIVRGEEPGGIYFISVFTWRNQETPEHPPASVLAVWKSMEPLVETRNGHAGMEISKVQIVQP